tara:strand:+ start:71 stop:373 length:303 start_codon:yes stop_codon:yes gene_type:complete
MAMMQDLYKDSASAYQRFQRTGLYLFLLPVLLVALVFMIALTPIRLIDPAVNHAMHGQDVDRDVRNTTPSLTGQNTNGTPKENSPVEAGDGTLENNGNSN